MILAIFLIPILYFANAFLIGRCIKRIKISANPFLCTIIGFFGFFTICYFFDIFLYMANVNIWTYLIFFSIIQAILIVIYLINWKYIFITASFDLKKLLTFIIVFGLTMLIAWLSFRDIHSQFGLSWLKTIPNDFKPDMNNTIWFRTADNDIITNFSAFNIFNIFWMNIFKFNDYDTCLKFCNWCWTICGSAMMACIATWLVPTKTGPVKVIFSSVICLTFVVVILAFIESFAICDTWVLMLVFIYVMVLIKHEPHSSLKLFYLTTLLISFLAVNSTSMYTVVCLWLFSLYWSIRNKENSVNYFVCLSWPIILIIFGFASVALYWLLALGNGIMLFIMLITIFNFSRKGSPVWSVKFARAVSKNSAKVVYTFIGILLVVILIANFYIFHEYYHWDAKNIDYKSFLTFTYKYIWTIEIKYDWEIAVINGVLYAFFLALIVTFIVARNMKKSKLYPIAKNDTAIKLGIASSVLFLNPLVIHVLRFWSSSYEISLPLNTLVLNILFAAPVFIFLLKVNNNVKT